MLLAAIKTRSGQKLGRTRPNLSSECTVCVHLHYSIIVLALVAAVLSPRRADHRGVPARPRRARAVRTRGTVPYRYPCVAYACPVRICSCAHVQLRSAPLCFIAPLYSRVLVRARRARWRRPASPSSGCATSSASSRTRPTSVRYTVLCIRYQYSTRHLALHRVTPPLPFALPPTPPPPPHVLSICSREPFDSLSL